MRRSAGNSGNDAVRSHAANPIVVHVAEVDAAVRRRERTRERGELRLRRETAITAEAGKRAAGKNRNYSIGGYLPDERTAAADIDTAICSDGDSGRLAQARLGGGSTGAAGETAGRAAKAVAGEGAHDAVPINFAYAVVVGIRYIDRSIRPGSNSERSIELGGGYRTTIAIEGRVGGAAKCVDDVVDALDIAARAISLIKHVANRVVKMIGSDGPTAETEGAGVDRDPHGDLLNLMQSQFTPRRIAGDDCAVPVISEFWIRFINASIDVTNVDGSQLLSLHRTPISVVAVPGEGRALVWLCGEALRESLAGDRHRQIDPLR